MRLYGISFEEPDPTPSPDQVVSWFPTIPGLYLHIPFCRTLCPFCPYNKVRYEEDLAGSYMACLEKEIDAYLTAESGPFPSLYVGGGTPTLCLGGLERLLAKLPVTGERAIEVLPTHMTPAGASHLLGLGFDFVSLGVQSFDRRVLQRLRRPTSVEANLRAMETAIGRFACVDVDLIFDAGYDDPDIMLSDLEICFEHGVDQVSTYPLMRFGYTPFGKAEHDRRVEHTLLRRATDLATSCGYERRSVWTFNRAGAPSYTSITRPYYLGIGAGAASYAGRVFSIDHFGLDQYRRAVDDGRLPIALLARLPRPAAAAYRLFWQAYTGHIPIDEDDRLLTHPVASLLTRVARLGGWLQSEDGSFALTPDGYNGYDDLERWVTYHLIEPLWGELMHEHEAAV